jgi:A/G-specific adenine glycosylase
MLAEKLLPDADVDTYTQGLMDLGATVCTRRDPSCAACPLMLACNARLNKLVDIYPMSIQKKTVKRKSIYMIIFVHNSRALILKNSESGLWPGLWGFVDSDTFSKKILNHVAKNFDLNIQSVSQLDSFRHRLTHIDYSVHPIKVNVSGSGASIDRVGMKWVDLDDKSLLPISVPVRRILNSIC